MLKHMLDTVINKFSDIRKKVSDSYFLTWLFMSSMTFVCFLSPCLIFLLLNFKKYSLRIDGAFLCMFIPMSLALSALKNKLVFLTLSLFIIMEMVQFAHMFYFGEPISPFAIEMMMTEYAEILESSLGMNFTFFIFPLVVLIPYGFLIYIYKNISQKRKQFVFPIIFIFILFSYFPRRIFKKKVDINGMLPGKDVVSVYNDLKVISGFFFYRLPKILNKEIQNNKFYNDYVVEKIETLENINIIVIFGESNNVNKMSLFGFEKKTTPILENIAKDDKNFVYKKALSSGVSTIVSTNMFFNVRREPDNKKQFFKKATNLFDLAKNNNFETFYFSAQSSGTLNNISTNSIKHIVTRENILYEITKKGEIFLLNKIKEKQKYFQKRNFIVIQQRNIHSPYHNNYKNESEKFSIFRNTNDRLATYYNAMLYNDYLVSSIFNYFKENTKIPTYIFFVSDHGELLGDNNKWGHGLPDKAIAETPFIATFYNINDAKFKKKLDNLFVPTHYEISKIIAEKLGYKIINSNEVEGEFFINFTDLFGDAGYIKVIKNSKRKILEYKE